MKATQPLLERACEFGDHRACSEAASVALAVGFESAQCGQAEVCYYLGRESCSFPCPGTEVNEGMAVDAYQRGCKLGNSPSCIMFLKYMNTGHARMVKALGGNPDSIPCGHSSLKGTIHLPRKERTLSELCQHGADYCAEGFFLPCMGLANQRAHGHVSDSEWNSSVRVLEQACTTAAKKGHATFGSRFACEASRLLAKPPAIEFDASTPNAQ